MLEAINCCGFLEIPKIQDYSKPKECMHEVYYSLQEREFRGAYIIFTDHMAAYKGKAFAKYVEKNKLGEVLYTPPRMNSNTGNQVRMWTWAYDKEAIHKLAKKEGWDVQWMKENPPSPLMSRQGISVRNYFWR